MDTTSRSLKSILFENLFTLFNIMLAIIAAFVISTGSYKDCLFVGVIVVNCIIGIVTELKAKKQLDSLAIIASDQYMICSKDNKYCSDDEIESDDIVYFKAGQQFPIDGVVVAFEAFVDESIMTGESNLIQKKVGDEILSGSILISGDLKVLVTKTMRESQAYQMNNAAKTFKLANSDLRDGINKILKIISFAIVPIALLLVFTQLHIGVMFNDAILQASAGIIGMIPEGLVLLTSVNFAISAIILAKKKVLVTELNSVETLARITDLILDKTGTITDGSMAVEKITDLEGRQFDDIDALEALYQLAILPGSNKTSEAIGKYILDNFTKDIRINCEIDEYESFSSANKYSSITINNHKYILGAPDILLTDVAQYILNETQTGKRVLVLICDNKPICAIICKEKIRKNAKDIIGKFIKSGVNVQIVSGDSDRTVKAIAADLGISESCVVSRATPDTKLKIVKSLQKNGRIVAMTGDGINDILALKEADIGIAMKNAAPSSKAVANLVLLNNDFAVMPDIVAQGRRVIANIERVASLFLVKTFYCVTLTILTVAFQTNYPFFPRHLTLVSALTIGIPAFFLALPKNNTPYASGFLKRVLSFSLPFGILIAVLVQFSNQMFANYQPLLNVLVLISMAFVVLLFKCRPLKSWRILLWLILVLVAVAIFVIPFTKDFFELIITNYNI